jgi:hypothetical protein
MRNRLEAKANERLGVGKSVTLRQRVNEVLAYFLTKGIDEACLCFVLGVDSASDITTAEVTQARRLKTGIEDGELNPKELIDDFARAVGSERDANPTLDEPSADPAKKAPAESAV